MSPHTAGRLHLEPCQFDEGASILIMSDDLPGFTVARIHPLGEGDEPHVMDAEDVDDPVRRDPCDRANAARLAACWNACEGLTLEEIAALGELLRTTSPGDGLRMITRITRE